MASTTSSNQFDAPIGTYSVQLGNSFTSPGSKDAANYYTFKFNSRLNPTMSLRKATLEKTDNDSYTAEWDALEGNNSKDNTQLNYDATPSQPQEVDCILLYDEATQTFTLQRPTLKFTMRKSRKRKVVKPQLPEPKAPKTTQAASKMPAKTVPGASSSPSITKSDKKATGSKTTPKKSSTPSSATTEVIDQRRSSVDDFAMDIESQMMDILEDDDDDDDDEDEGNQSTTTAPPAAPTGTAASSDTDTFEEVVVHPTQNQRPSTDSPAATNRKRKYKMASQPIRRLENDSSPVAAGQSSTPSIPQPPQPRREFGGKSISSAAALAANRNRKMAQQQQQNQHSQSSDSSSGSSSSDDESGSSSSDESGSSSSGSEDEGSSDSDSSSDDDMDGLVADISRSLSADTQSVPPSPSAARSHNTPVVPERSPYSASPATRGTPNKNGGPMSLRALYNDGDQGEEDEGITSSDSGSDDD